MENTKAGNRGEWVGAPSEAGSLRGQGPHRALAEPPVPRRTRTPGCSRDKRAECGRWWGPDIIHAKWKGRPLLRNY